MSPRCACRPCAPQRQRWFGPDLQRWWSAVEVRVRRRHFAPRRAGTTGGCGRWRLPCPSTTLRVVPPRERRMSISSFIASLGT